MPRTRELLRWTTVACACAIGLAADSAAPLSRTIPPGEWTLVHARPAVGKYEDLAFPDSLHGWVVSASGTIIATIDGGETWTVQASGLGRLRSIDFLDSKHGFAGTVTGTLYTTTDGGTTWTDITSTLPRPAKGFCGITHVGKRVHIVGRYTGGAADYFYSPDAGKTWQASDLTALADGLVDVNFLNNDVGFIGGMGKAKADGQPGSAIILKTTDGGKKWRVVFEHDGGRGFAWKLFPVSNKMIYAGLQSQDGIYRVAKTTDAGDHWETLTVVTGRPMGPAIQGIGFVDANTGWVGGFFAGMYGTTDGGRTWSAVPVVDAVINRYEKAGSTLFTAGSRGILRYDAHAPERAKAPSR
jgi:photosystem II stability/assembly factor-like uncharacterized protein